MRKRQANACVGQQQGTNLAARRGFAEKDHADQDGEGAGVGDRISRSRLAVMYRKPMKSRAGGPVVAQQPERRHPGPIRAG